MAFEVPSVPIPDSDATDTGSESEDGGDDALNLTAIAALNLTEQANLNVNRDDMGVVGLGAGDGDLGSINADVISTESRVPDES